MNDTEVKSGPALDAMIAERVMGWHDIQPPRHAAGGFGTPWRGKPPGRRRASDVSEFPKYSTDIAADFAVLAHVREKWDESRQWKFVHALAAILRIRDTEWTTFGTLHLALFGNGDAKGVQVGDYSRAALAAVASV